MKLKFLKGETPLALPHDCLPLLADADAADLRVLLHIAACEADGSEFDTAVAADKLQLNESEVRSSVKFWRGAGVLSTAAAKKTEEKTEAKPLRETRRTKLNTDELCKISETNAEFAPLLNLAQQTAGWIFNPNEIEIIARLYSELKLSGEYILALINYFICRRERPLRYVEEVAYDYAVKKGITSAKALEERLLWLERFEGRAGRIRSMFGIGSRDLTKDEEAYLTAWFDTYGFSDDVIRLAYEKTVKQIGKASVGYANTILKSWYEEGVKTAADVPKKTQRATAKTSATGAKQNGIATQSFNVADAFQKALERSYGEKKE
ncbi:MAG: DnaD domain protein [Clostridia bacterium]|nr:DnaD domain protein [Clostridia bacterium]